MVHTLFCLLLNSSVFQLSADFHVLYHCLIKKRKRITSMDGRVDYQTRLRQLTEDNAFVNVNDVLKQDAHTAPTRVGSSASAGDISSFLDGVDMSNKKTSRGQHSGDVGMRFNITSALDEQHKNYLSWLSENKRRKRKRSEGIPSYGRKGMTSPLFTGEALFQEVQEEKMILERWKHAMIEKADHLCSLSSSAISLVYQSVKCPSFEAMTAPNIKRRRADEYMKNIRKRENDRSLHKTISVGESTHHLCSVCLLPAQYRCNRCRSALFCSEDCHSTHESARCLKYTV